MPNDLQLLISHLESELEYLTTQIQEKAEDWEFEDAQYFMNAYKYTRLKLQRLRYIEKPQLQQVQLLEMRLKGSERRLKQLEELKDADYLVPTDKHYYHLEYLTELNDQKTLMQQIEALQQAKPHFFTDNDRLLNLIADVRMSKLNVIQIKIEEAQDYISLTKIEDHLELQIVIDKNGFSNYEIEDKIADIKNLGFSYPESKRYLLDDSIRDSEILKDIALIFFEIFNRSEGKAFVSIG